MDKKPGSSSNFVKHHPYFLITLSINFIVLVVFFIFALLKWPGSPHFCIADDHCYCETFHEGLVVQPGNTWSNLLAVIIGLYIAWESDSYQSLKEIKQLDDNSEGLKKSPLLYKGPFVLVYANLVCAIGTGSMFFHGSMTTWGGLIDNITMNTFVSFLFLWDIKRLFKLDDKLFVFIYVGANIIGAWFSLVPHLGRKMFGVLAGFMAGLELLILILQKIGLIRIKRSIKLFIYSIGTFGLAVVVWTLSKTGGPWCLPDSILQGHALWHFLVAIAPFFLFRYLQSEILIEKQTKRN